MKRTFIILASLLTLAFTGCIQDTFAPDSLKTVESVTPKDLKYATLAGATEYYGFSSGQPTLDTDDCVPTWEIVAGRDQDGTAISLESVSISQPTYEEYEVSNYGITETVKIWNYASAGIITVAAGHGFTYGNTYYLDIKATVEWNDAEYSTTFTDGYSFTVSPNVPTASEMMYLPLSQNLNTTESGDKTTTPSFSLIGSVLAFDNIHYALSAEDDLIFDIDSETGAITLDASYTYPGEVTTYNPSFILTNTLTGGSADITGSASILTIYVSDTDITADMPQQTKVFFTPDLYTTPSADFKSVIYTEGTYNFVWDNTSTATNLIYYASNTVMDDLYEAFTGETYSTNYSNMTASATGIAEEHESWIFFAGQNLTTYSFGFDVYAVFYMSNRYVEYTYEGKPVVNLTPYYSTDFSDYSSDTPDLTSGTWNPLDGDKDVTFTLYSSAGVATVAPYLPCPGDQAILDDSSYHTGTTDPLGSIKNSAYSWEVGNCIEVRMQLNDYLTATNFTLALQMKSDGCTGTAGTTANFSGGGRPGVFALGGVYMYAVEQSPEN